jgi:hypothetical protein
MADKIVVSPSFRLDVNGKLFRIKNSNTDIQDTPLFETLLNRLSIVKGDLPYFPDVGLKQHLHKFDFNTRSDASAIIAEFEADLENQLKTSVSIKYEMDVDAKTLKLFFDIDGMDYPLEVKYTAFNGSIKPINYSFNEE